MLKNEILTNIRNYAESILRALPHPDEITHTESKLDLQPKVDRVRQLAEQTIREVTSPVKIGVLGEFSCGKTVLLGSLIGYANLLPVDQVPSTGNITVLRFNPQPDLSTTRLSNYTIEYMDEREVKECLRFILRKLRQHGIELAASRTQATSTDAVFEKLNALNPDENSFGSEVLRWCESAWQLDDPQLRFWVYELRSFVQAYLACGTAMCGRDSLRSYKADPLLMHDGIKLAKPKDKILALSLKELPPSPVPLASPPKELTLDVVSRTFPLIRRVQVEVNVSTQIWDLSSLRAENEFVMVDFPGLGSTDSGLRDAFLCLHEMAEVHTILLMLNARSQEAGAGKALNIYTMMKEHYSQQPPREFQDRILVGVGHFDSLPLGLVDNDTILDKIIAESENLPRDPMPADATVLTDESLLKRINTLQYVVSKAEALTSIPNRVVFLSPPVAIHKLAKRYPNLEVASKEFMDDLQGRIRKNEGLYDKWKRISGLLLESNPKSNLGRLLGALVEDGGLRLMKQVIEEHVTEHAFKHLYFGARRAAEALRVALKDLDQAYAGNETMPALDPAAYTLVQTLGNVMDIYMEMKREFEKRLPELWLKGPAANIDSRISVSQRVQKEVIFKFFEWRHWHALFDKAGRGFIKSTTPSAPDAFDIIISDRVAGDGRRKQATATAGASFPNTSDDFFEPFQQTVRELEDFTKGCLREAVGNWFDQFSQQLFVCRDDLLPLLRNAASDERDGSGVTSAELARLESMLDPKQIEGIVLEYVLSAFEGEDRPAFAENVFPLPHSGKDGQASQVFPWAGAGYQGNPKRVDHVAQVLRIRDELLGSARQYFGQLITEALRKFNEIMLRTLTRSTEVLNKIMKEPILLQMLTAPGQQIEDGLPDWTRRLKQAASILPPVTDALAERP